MSATPVAKKSIALIVDGSKPNQAHVNPQYVEHEYIEHGPGHEPGHGQLEKAGNIWICIYFPRIALEVLDCVDGIPVVVIEEVRGKQVIHTPCEIALSQGVMPGMPLNAANVLCNNLSIQIRNPAGEEKRLQLLSERVAKFTPNVSLSPPDILFLEVSRSLKLFGGFKKLFTRIEQEFSENLVISSAPTAVAAQLLARNGMEKVVRRKAELKSVLGKIEISSTDLPVALVEQLSKCGLQTLRDLWRLSRADLGRRFGAKLLDFLDKACGEQPDPKTMASPRTRFFYRMELPVETENNKLLILAAQNLFEKAQKFLESRSAATEIMTFRFWYQNPPEEHNKYASLIIRSQKAHRQPQKFLPQFREKLERTRIFSPVGSVSLRIDQVVPYCATSVDLFQPKNADYLDWSQLADILMARVGSSMLYQVAPENDHRPEKSWRCNKVSHVNRAKTKNKSLSVSSRPLWLLPKPEQIAQPIKNLKLVSGIERIENGWWADKDIRRDYYVAVTDCGNRCWIFRDLDNDGQSDQWYVHGVYG